MSDIALKDVVDGTSIVTNPANPAPGQEYTVEVGAVTDAQHGNRGGGSLHSAATTSAAGFMSASQVTQLNSATTDAASAAADAATALSAAGSASAAAAAASSAAASAASDAAAAQTTANAAVPKSLYDAQSVLVAISDNTPVALTMGASTILARLASGDIIAATPSQLRTLLSLVTGTDVQAYDADLAAIAALSSAADKMPYSTAAQTWALATLTAAGRAMNAAADAAAQTALLSAMVGDSGSGGTKGLVPAPSAGDAAANKSLKASGTWGVANASFVGAYASKPSAPNSGDFAVFTDGIIPQIYDGSAWRSWVNGVMGYSPVAASAIASMSTDNVAAVTASDLTGCWKFIKTTETAKAAVYYESGTGNFTVTACFSDLVGHSAGAGITASGVAFRESGTGKLCTWELQHDQGAAGQLYMIRKKWNSSVSFSASTTSLYPLMDGRPIFLRLSYDGTNVLYSYSRDGVEFRTCITEAKTTCFTTAPNQVGVSIYADGTTLQTYCISYKKT